MGTERLNMKKTKIILSVLAVLLIVALLCAVIAALKKDGAGGYTVYSTDDTADKTADSSCDEICNILFMGLDDAAGLCDVMMLIGVNFTDRSVAVAQLPRDTYAKYTEASYKKLNGAYRALGGARETADFISECFEIEIHRCVCIRLDTLGRIVDALGGIDINIPFDMKYSDAEQGLYIDLKKGITHLDGDAAQQFVRYRSGYFNGDLGRIDAQKLFMSSFFARLTESFSPVTLAKLVGALKGVETDFEMSEISSMATRALEMSTDNLFMLTLPGKEAIAKKSGAGYYVLSASAMAEVLQKYFGGNGGFDSEMKFLNTDYDSFEKIYNEYTEYSVTTVSELLRNGTVKKEF